MTLQFKGTRHLQTAYGGRLVVFSIDGGHIWASLPPHFDEVNHSPTGFEWGYWGSGPAQLAYALLRTYFRVVHGDDTQDQARALYQRFKQDVIGSLQQNEWELNDIQITQWLEVERGKHGF